MTIEIVKLGMAMSVQDKGRFGYRAFGVPISGALDQSAYEMANALIGNASGAPVLELTMNGPHLKFYHKTRIAITGANMNPVDEKGYPVPMWQAVSMEAGQELRFGYATSGMRAYIAFEGGIETSKIMDSASDYPRAGIFPCKGKALQVGDILTCKARESNVYGYIPIDKRPVYGCEVEVRVILGPHEAAFTDKGIETFLSTAYCVSPTSDRMGMRLEGEFIEHKDSADILSDGIVPGAIQIPKDGQPIVLLADAQTTGGYTKIAHVIQMDLSKLAQLRPRDKVRFKAIGLKEAHALLEEDAKKKEDMFKRKNAYSRRYFNVKSGQRSYSITVEEVENDSCKDDFKTT